MPTPTPWQVEEYRNGNLIVIGTNTKEVAYTPRKSTEDAAHIVRCVNAHDTLVAALEALHEVMSDLLDDPHAEMTTQRYAALQAIDKSAHALALAKKGV